MASADKNKTAIWAITPNGVTIAQQLKRDLPQADLYTSAKIRPGNLAKSSFDKLSHAVAKHFHRYAAHIFIMASGIVVRVIAPFIENKVQDPAVVVVDDQGRHAISLLAGHLGGANDLTQQVAQIIDAHPVITTATDVNDKAAIDVLAKEKNLTIENPTAIKTVNMALLTDQPICLHDPFAVMPDDLANAVQCQEADLINGEALKDGTAAVYVGDRQLDFAPGVLILRPATLVAGIGCNRNTPMEEIKALLEATFKKYHLAGNSLDRLASIDLKADEAGLVDLANALKVSLDFFSRDELNRVKDIQTPSEMVEKHIGVKSVCEAAAILASQTGTLIVPKQITPNVTVAIARKAFLL
jgi:cobalt-precorrin 5A hydrolase